MRRMRTPPPPPKPARVSVPISARALEVFQELADASGQSLARCIAEWLDDTAEGAIGMSQLISKAKASPRHAVAQLHLMASGLQDMTATLQQAIDKASGGGAKPLGSPGPAGPVEPPADGRLPPRTGNTGGQPPLHRYK